MPLRSPGSRAFNKVAVVVNAPPSSGELRINPRHGLVLETLFVFENSGCVDGTRVKSVDSEFLRRRFHRWVDDIEHYPLLYSFYYARSGPSGSEYQLFASSLQTHLSGVLLPQGQGNRSHIIGISYVTDQARTSCLSLVRDVTAHTRRCLPSHSLEQRRGRPTPSLARAKYHL